MKKSSSIYFIILFIIIGCINSFANDTLNVNVLQKYEAAEKLAEKNNFALYIAAAKNIFPLLKKQNHTEEYLQTLLGLMNSHSYIGNYSDSKMIAKLLESEINSFNLSPKEKLFYFLRIASCYARIGNYDDAIIISKEALVLGKKSNLYLLQIYNNLGALNRKRGDWTDAINYYKKALSIFENSSSLIGKLPTVNHNLGRLYFKLKSYEVAHSHFNKGINTLKFIEDKEAFRFTKAALYTSIGLNYLYLNDTTNSKKYLNQVLEIQQRLNSN